MIWYEEPGVERVEAASVEVWRLVGDWTRDLPLAVRRGAVADLSREVREALVVDLSDVKFIDSWGEEAICDALLRVREEGRRVVWTWDASRRSEYDGVRRSLERRGLSVASYNDRGAAIAAVRHEP